jgi:PEP-CTERM motif
MRLLFQFLTTGDFTEGFILPGRVFADWEYTPATITQTPEPTTLFLVGTGLAGIVRQPVAGKRRVNLSDRTEVQNF